jgi:hypothetical protein
MLRLVDTEENDVECRQDNKGQNRRHEQTAHDGEGHRPPEHRGRDWNEAKNGRDGGQHDRPEAGNRAFDHRIPQLSALRALGLDLLDENDRIARDHAHQRQNSENCDEAERPARDQQRGDNTDQSHRHEAENHGKSAETMQLRHKEQQHQKQHGRNHRIDRGL